MEETYLLNHPGVRKKILAGGTGPMPHCPPGTKVVTVVVNLPPRIILLSERMTPYIIN